MTISLTSQEYFELFQEADQEQLQFDPSDELDTTYKYDGRIIRGWRRCIQLRKGIRLLIINEKCHNRLAVYTPEYEEPLHWHFWLSGKLQVTNSSSSHKQTNISLEAGKHLIFGRGSEGRVIDDCSHTEPFLEVKILVQPEVLRSFVSDSSGELPAVFKHLVESPDGGCYKQVRETPPKVTPSLQQIIQCPYQGMTKRMFLEGKATEIIALMLEEEAAVQEGEFRTSLLKSDRLERIYHAKEILLKNLSNPPSLMELASQVGICDYSLERGFREVFCTTVFGYLRDRRLEKASALLLDGQMKVTFIARAVGYDSPTSFSAAFKRKYGASPNAYQFSRRML